MSVVTFRIDDQKHERLKAYAKTKNISLNKLLDELSTMALVEFDTQTRFQKLSQNGDKKRGLELLNKL